jgi:hypothetical protein
MVPTEDVKGKITIVLIVPVKEATQLMAVDWVVGGVDIEHDLRRRFGVSLEEQLHEQPFDISRAACNLLVAAVLVRADGGQLKAIESALARQWLAPVPLPLPGLTSGIDLANDRGEQGIAPEVVVIVEVFVSQRQGVDTLGHKFLDRVFNQVGITMVGETGGELPDDGREFFSLAEQQGSTVGRNVTAIEGGRDFAGTESRKV